MIIDVRSVKTNLRKCYLFQKKDEPTEAPCTECGGEVKQVVTAPYFGYDNIKTRHSQNNKVPSWYTDKIKDLKNSKRFPNNNL